MPKSGKGTGLVAADIREMPDADIRSRVADLEEERFRLRFRAATETLEECAAVALATPRHCAAQDGVAGTRAGRAGAAQ